MKILIINRFAIKVKKANGHLPVWKAAVDI